MTVNLTKYQDEITEAWRKVVDRKDENNWALYGYEGTSNIIKLMSIGSNGLAGLVQEFNCSLIQYAFCRVIDKKSDVNKLVLINWQGDSSPLLRKGLCANHLGDVVNYFKGSSQTITIRNDEEATVPYLMDQILKSRPNRITVPSAKESPNEDDNSTQDSNLNSITSSSDELSLQITKDRKSFWERQEEEEKNRLIEERKRAREREAQFEKERKLKEQQEAKKLADTIKDRDRLIEATRTAERRMSSSSSASASHSIISVMSAQIDGDDDDERVGRRSELLRLERNQETQSLISKGQIKSRRAMFENMADQNQQNSIKTSQVRKSSGSSLRNRLDTFQSVNGNQNTSTDVNKISEATDNIKLQDPPSMYEPKADNITKEEVESVKITKDELDDNRPTETTNGVSKDYKHEVDEISQVKTTNNVEPPRELDLKTNGQDSNNHLPKTPDEIKSIKNIVDSLLANREGSNKPKAIAIYDYQAADKTEISFDPNDLIGCIEKIDVGWWHGVVLTGSHTGESGLFPHNHVMELQFEAKDGENA